MSNSAASSEVLHAKLVNPEWWRTAVIYQIYPRSFADGNGDGMGDLKGITDRLESLQELGIDAIWFSPFFRSPQRDAGYDVSDYTDIDPLFGTLADFDRMLSKAKGLGIKIIVDLVPNHSSDQHPLFQAALAAGPGSPERDVYMFRDGKGRGGELPPNNWESVFGGPAWTRIREPNGNWGQWYLHIFDSSQPDFNWENPFVADFFDDVLRFWLDRGVDGFRIDVAHGLRKAAGLPDVDINNSTMSGAEKTEEEAELEAMFSDWIETSSNAYAQMINKPGEPEIDHPFWGRDDVHPIIRRWRTVLDEYQDRAMCAEAWVLPLSRMARWVRPDEYHQTFNFGYMETPWDPKRLFKVVTESLVEFGKVGAPSTWVLSNHDVIRHVSRMGLMGLPPQGDGLGPHGPQPDEALGLRRGRAATAFMLGLPGGAYLYQGEELGLPEHTTIEDKYRQDPTFFRTGGKRVGRDGCRVPIPWEAHGGATYGFNSNGFETWLPQPASYQRYARDAQQGVAGSTLELYKRMIAVRKEHGLGSGEFRWAPEYSDKNTLAYINNGVLVLSNFTGDPVVLPAGEILVSTQADALTHGELEHDQTIWIKL